MSTIGLPTNLKENKTKKTNKHKSNKTKTDKPKNTNKLNKSNKSLVLEKISNNILKQRQVDELQKSKEIELLRLQEEEAIKLQEAEQARLEKLKIKKEQKKIKHKLTKKNKIKEENEKRLEQIRNDLLTKRQTEAKPETTTDTEMIPQTVPCSSIYKSPICCVIGHVNSGKTTILDKIRNSKVQENEASGITQQIGATYYPCEELKKICKYPDTIDMPGLLLIDTPGHDAFINLKHLGTSICDFVIFVVDVMNSSIEHIEESIEIIKAKKIPFVVALNQIDRLNKWQADMCEPNKHYELQEILKLQNNDTLNHYRNKMNEMIISIASNGINSALFYDNTTLGTCASIVPMSAKYNIGIIDLLHTILKLSNRIRNKLLTYDSLNNIILQEVECSILEIKKTVGLGITLDCILINGVLNRRDNIILATLNGPLTTLVKSIHIPDKPMTEIRTAKNFINVESVRAAMCVKLVLKDMAHDFIAGTPIFKISGKTNDEIVLLKDIIQKDINKVVTINDNNDNIGICLVSSTLGSIEALRHFLKENKLPILHADIGLNKKTIIHASTMLTKNPLYACILAFDVEVNAELQEYANKNQVKIFVSDTIYKLLDMFTIYMNDYNKLEDNKKMSQVVWPCILKILPIYIFNKKNPIILGIKVIAGTLHLNTPMCLINENNKILCIGKVISIEQNNISVQKAIIDDEVAIKIEPDNNDIYEYGRHFNDSNLLYSHISRESINSMKTYFRKETIKNIDLIKNLKLVLDIA